MKKTILRLLAAVCAFALCGCVRMRMKLDVDSSGKIKSTMTLLLQEDLLNFNGANMEEQIDSMISEYRKQYPLASVKKAEETEGDTVYTGVTVSGITSDEVKAEVADGTVTLRFPVAVLTNELASSVMSGMDFSLNDLKQYGAQVTIEINMPAAATSNVGTVDGKHVFIDVLDLPAGTDEIVVSSKAGLPLSTLLLIAGGVLIAAGGGYWMLHKKNETTEEM